MQHTFEVGGWNYTHDGHAKGLRVGRILIATTNRGKLREIRRALEGVSARWLSLEDLHHVPEPEETGRTFAENALLKARYYAAASDLPTVAEDSGLAIDVLGGRPGVESARYPGATYPDKFRGLYRELAPHPRPWTARFFCSLAFVGQAEGRGPKAEDKKGLTLASGLGPLALPVLFTCEATVQGEIAESPRGTYGFGYDPIFYYPPYSSTLGEVDEARKLAVSHRGKAFRQFRDWLQQRRGSLP
jgi:XTP/dITP diphosphohydrolase